MQSHNENTNEVDEELQKLIYDWFINFCNEFVDTNKWDELKKKINFSKNIFYIQEHILLEYYNNGCSWIQDSNMIYPLPDNAKLKKYRDQTIPLNYNNLQHKINGINFYKNYIIKIVPMTYQKPYSHGIAIKLCYNPVSHFFAGISQ